MANTANGAAEVAGKILMFADGLIARTISCLFTFDRGAAAPFAVGATATKVTNLDADKVDGIEGTAFLLKAGGVMTGQLQSSAGTFALPGLSVGDTDVGLYSSGANALDVATNGVKALGVDSTQFIDSPTQPRCAAVTAAAAQSINSAAWTAINFNSETYDVGTMHDNVTNKSRFTIPAGGDGLYLIGGLVCFDPNATGLRGCAVAKNGTQIPGTPVVVNNGGAGQTSVQAMTLQNLVAGDYVEIQGYQASGGALSTGNTDINSGFIVKLW